MNYDKDALENIRSKYPEKFAPPEQVFSRIRPGDRIFLGTGCAEPQYLVQEMVGYVESNPKAFFDAEIYHVWTLGVAPYTQDKFKRNFRHNSFFVGNDTRKAVNEGLADYTPVFLSQVPALFRKRRVEIDVALIQVSPPNPRGWMSLGIGVDITMAAVKSADIVIAQVNPMMPKVHGDTFIRVEDVDFVLFHDEPLLEYKPEVPDVIAQKIGKYVSRLIEDGDTIQVGYGSVPNAILANLKEKKHLGVHTELFSQGLADLMEAGVIDNSRKTIHAGKSIATFCMGFAKTYEFVHDNPAVEFKPVEYTNDPLVIARNDEMTAINSAIEIDLTGQSTAESIGGIFYSGIGGQADFMRGAMMSRNGRTILALQSTANDGKISRVVPFLKEGSGVTLNRGDVHYVVTEYGIAYLHGKNIRERAMELIAIAHPDHREWLIGEARAKNLIFRDQVFVPGKAGEYPEDLEEFRTTKKGLGLLFRPVRISDEPLMKEFFYSLSDESIYRRFVSPRKDMPHERLQSFVAVDYSREMVTLAVVEKDGEEEIVGLGQYFLDNTRHSAEVAFVVRDDMQNLGIGRELLKHLIQIAKHKGLHEFTAEVLSSNSSMLHLFQAAGFTIRGAASDGMQELVMRLR